MDYQWMLALVVKVNIMAACCSWLNSHGGSWVLMDSCAAALEESSYLKPCGILLPILGHAAFVDLEDRTSTSSSTAAQLSRRAWKTPLAPGDDVEAFLASCIFPNIFPEITRGLKEIIQAPK